LAAIVYQVLASEDFIMQAQHEGNNFETLIESFTN